MKEKTDQEEAAHELMELDIHIKVTSRAADPSEQDEEEQAAEENVATALPTEEEARRLEEEQKKKKLKWPPLPLGRPPSTLDLLFQVRVPHVFLTFSSSGIVSRFHACSNLVFQIRQTIEDEAIRRLHRMYNYLDVPRMRGPEV